MKSTYEESRRQRHQMQKVFDQIRKNHSGAKGSANTEEEDTNIEDEDEEDDTEDDLALEKRKEERDLEESNRRYEDMALPSDSCIGASSFAFPFLALSSSSLLSSCSLKDLWWS